jgi:hypothetical protein
MLDPAARLHDGTPRLVHHAVDRGRLLLVRHENGLLDRHGQRAGGEEQGAQEGHGSHVGQLSLVLRAGLVFGGSRDTTAGLGTDRKCRSSSRGRLIYRSAAQAGLYCSGFLVEGDRSGSRRWGTLEVNEARHDGQIHT